MTIGNRTVDLRQVYPETVPTKVGRYSNKIWNGGDAPVVVPIIRKRRNWRWVPSITRKGVRRLVREELDPIEYPVYPKRNKLKLRGEHAYTMQYVGYDDGLCSVRYGPTGKYQKTSLATGFGGFTTRFGPQWVASDTLKLVNKLGSKIRGSGFNIGVFLTELPMAAKMISESAIKIAKAIKLAKRGNFWGAEEALVGGVIPVRQLNYRKRAASNWLELQYGWLPLFGDVYEGAEMLAHMTESPFETIVRSRRQRNKAGAVATGAPLIVGLAESFLQETMWIKAIIREVDVAQLTGLTDPYQIVWEKLPWSFVADWFLPIGTYLEARGVASAVAGTFVTSKKAWYHGAKPYGTQYGGGVSLIGAEHCYYDRINFDRTVGSSLDVPFPSFQPLSSVASWRHCANAIALVSQLFK